MVVWSVLVVILLLFSCCMRPEISTASSSTGLLIPLYVYPNSDDWNAVIAVKGNHTNVPMIAIVNPNNGPDEVNCTLSSYQDGIHRLHEKGIIVVGYVYTQWGYRDLTGPNGVEENIASWKTCYPDIDGIFLDEMSSSPSYAGYYSTLSHYAVMQNFSSDYIIGNPGQDTSPNFIGVTSNLNIFENPGMLSLSDLIGNGGWHEFYDKKNFSLLSFGQTTVPSPSEIGNFSNFVHYLYVTDNTGNGHSQYDPSTASPWNTTSSYLMQLAADLDKPSTSVIVRSVNLTGSPIAGYYVHISQGQNWIPSGFTPLNYNATAGIRYVFSANSFGNCAFDHWQDTGSTNPSRSILVNFTSVSLTAVYRNSTGVCI